jgi:hypothetical protein
MTGTQTRGGTRAAASLVTLQYRPWRRANLDDKQLTIGSNALLPRKGISAEAPARELFHPATHLRRLTLPPSFIQA